MKFRKKPVIINAIKWTGGNAREIAAFCEGEAEFPNYGLREPLILEIKTLEGIMSAQIGDWIIEGVNGEFYPCKPDIFEKIYEEVTE
nr:hypothetical protein [uncultured Trichococcus sp.]